MVRGHFDALTRLVASKHSRRAALAALVGGALFGHGPETTAAAKKAKSAKTAQSAQSAQDVTGEADRRRRPRRRDRGCKQAGGFPSPRKPCCPGLVLDASGACSGCPSCAAGQRCVNNQCLCDAQSCPSGCCTAVGTSGGTCQQGSAANQCGTGGRVCVACGGTTPTCNGNICLCNAATQSCVNGCCDGVACQPGTASTLCGGVGRACVSCPAPQTCQPLAIPGGGGACV